MSMLAILIPLGLVLVVIAVLVFLWAVRSGQFEDMDSPAWQIVLDDDASPAGNGSQEGPARSAETKPAQSNRPA